MSVSVAHPVDASTFLPGAQFSDAFSTVSKDTSLTARQAAERMFSRQPRWTSALMGLRDLIVAPLGLKTEKDARVASNKVGFFPVISETPQRLVAGLDDRHQDFRVVVDVAPYGDGRRVTLTTIVLTHNRLGRTYLATIMPFHRLIVPAMMRQLG